MDNKFDGILEHVVNNFKKSPLNHGSLPITRKGLDGETEDITIIAIRGNVGHAALLLMNYDDVLKQFEESKRDLKELNHMSECKYCEEIDKTLVVLHESMQRNFDLIVELRNSEKHCILSDHALNPEKKNE